MKINENEDEQFYPDEEGGEGQGGEGRGGKDGKIHFRFKDAASLEPRDDMLSPNELKRLLIVHKDIHKARVDNQRTTMEERKAAKEGRLHQLASHQERLMGMRGNSAASNFKSNHPLNNHAQFAGIDNKINSIPNQSTVETNQELRDKLENRFQHQFVPRSAPTFRPPGS